MFSSRQYWQNRTEVPNVLFFVVASTDKRELKYPVPTKCSLVPVLTEQDWSIKCSLLPVLTKQDWSTKCSLVPVLTEQNWSTKGSSLLEPTVFASIDNTTGSARIISRCRQINKWNTQAQDLLFNRRISQNVCSNLWLIFFVFTSLYKIGQILWKCIFVRNWPF